MINKIYFTYIYIYIFFNKKQLFNILIPKLNFIKFIFIQSFIILFLVNYMS